MESLDGLYLGWMDHAGANPLHCQSIRLPDCPSAAPEGGPGSLIRRLGVRPLSKVRKRKAVISWALPTTAGPYLSLTK